MIEPVEIAVSLIPVFIFLTALVFLDSYKLVRFRAILATIIAGCIVAGICLLLNYRLMRALSVEAAVFSRYIAPLTEELLKAACVIFLVKARRVGFMVDAAVQGFAVGAGFALIENIYYLITLENPNILLWIVRGFGTAALHGATTAIFGILSKGIADRRSSEAWYVFLPGLGAAVGIHSLFNHFIIPPEYTTILLLLVLPVIIVFVFDRSEKATRAWLGRGMDADMELLDLIVTDKIHDSPIGTYLQALKDRFPGPVVADMLCLLRIHCELALGAKGILLMRDVGIRPAENPDIKAKFEELKYLEKSLGKTGKLAILPFLKTSSRDLWQLYMVGQ